MRNTNFAHEFKFDNLKYYSQQSETNKNKSNAKRSQYLLNPIICEVIFDMTSIFVVHKKLLRQGPKKGYVREMAFSDAGSKAWPESRLSFRFPTTTKLLRN